MSLRNSATAYGSVSKFFHWLIFLLVLFMIVFGYLLERTPKPYIPVVYNIHKLTGLSILVLMILRGLWALMNPKPILAGVKAWERLLERSLHLLLYAVLIAMPLAGWIGSSAARKAPHLFGISFQLPVPESKTLDDNSFMVHYILSIAIVVLVTLHILAALYHHYIRKDEVLLRMMPHRGRR